MKVSPRLKIALAVGAVGAGVTIFVTAAVQQDYRQSANDPQVQLSQDAWAALARGAAPSDVVGTSHVDLSSSLAPFVMVFDAKRKLVATNATNTGGAVPMPPAGTLDYAKQHGPDRFTWQTANGDRYATVLMYTGSTRPGYVLAARNLYEVEKRENRLRLMALATLVGIAAVLVVFVLLY